MLGLTDIPRGGAARQVLFESLDDMGDRVVDSGVCVPDLREEQSMPVPRNKWVDVEGHVVDQVGIGMSQSFLVPREDKLMEIAAELVN